MDDAWQLSKVDFKLISMFSKLPKDTFVPISQILKEVKMNEVTFRSALKRLRDKGAADYALKKGELILFLKFKILEIE